MYQFLFNNTIFFSSCRLLRRRPDKSGGSSAPGQAPWKAPSRRRARRCRRRRRGAAPAGGRRRGKTAGAGKTGRVSSSAWGASFVLPRGRLFPRSRGRLVAVRSECVGTGCGSRPSARDAGRRSLYNTQNINNIHMGL